MKKVLACFCLVVFLTAAFYVRYGNQDFRLLCGTSSAEISSNTSADSATQPVDINQEKTKGIWFSYLDWNLFLRGKGEEEFRQQLDQIMQNLTDLGCNTVFLHVRAFGDAMYPSELFPWASSCSGTIGVNPGFDPLKLFVEKAHQNQISVHAWINPMRTMTDEEFLQIDDKYRLKSWYNEKSKRHQYFMKDGTGRYILIPSNPEVQQLIADGVVELIKNYEIDGIHLDDYFYPSGVDNLAENDTRYYQESGASVELNQWRRDGVSAMLSGLYRAAKEEDQDVVVGVSPQSSVTANYDKLFADVELWISHEGYLDYIVPQIYFGFSNSTQPFAETASSWDERMADSHARFYVGLASYKIGLENDAHAGEGQSEWMTVAQSGNDMLKRQILCLQKLSHCDGFCFYDYKSLFGPDAQNSTAVQQELEHVKEVMD